MKTSSGLLVTTALVVVIAVPAAAQISTIDYIGYGWESGQAQATDEFNFLGVADFVDPLFGVDLAAEELTLFVWDLVNLGGVDLGAGITMVPYGGGYMEICRDAAQDADWGVNPPNATAPSTFSDGELFFAGAFTDMVIFYSPDGSGSFEGHLDGVGGEMIDGACAGCVYSWGGVFSAAANAQLIEGYTMQVDGVLEVDAAVATEGASWDSVKALFRN